jgi:hypothetical protein
MRLRGLGIPGALCVLAWTVVGAVDASAQQPPPSSSWTFRLTPYIWLPSIDGEATIDLPPDSGGDGQFPIGPEDYLENLEFAFMGALEARGAGWSVLLDGIYIDFEDSDSAITAPIVPGGPGVAIDAETEFSGFVGHLLVGRELVRGPGASLDLFGGVRWMTLQVGAEVLLTGPLPPTLPGRELEAESTLLDGVVGVRGRIPLGGAWFAPYHLDLGAGESEFSWQALLGAGYSLKWGDLLLVYRHLDIDPEAEAVSALTLSGFALGVGFRL